MPSAPTFPAPAPPLRMKTSVMRPGGLLWYLLSKPDDWEVRIPDLQKKGAGRDKVVFLAVVFLAVVSLGLLSVSTEKLKVTTFCKDFSLQTSFTLIVSCHWWIIFAFR